MSGAEYGEAAKVAAARRNRLLLCRITGRSMLPVRPTVPAVKDANWVRNPIDAFVAEEFDKRKLVALPEADRRTLATQGLPGFDRSSAHFGGEQSLSSRPFSQGL